MTINPLSFFLATFVAFFLLISPAYAFLGKDKIPVLKLEPKMSQADFEKRTDYISETPQNNKDLAYQVRLPKGWIKMDVEASQTETVEGGDEIFKQIATFVSPPRIEHASTFRIRTIEISDMITVDDWFIGYMLQMGFSVEGMLVKSEREVLAQYALFEEGEPYTTLAYVTMSGSKIILAEYLVHPDVYETERDEQILAINGLSLLHPNLNNPVSMKTFSFVDIAKFDYPSSWSVHGPGISDIKRMEASVVNTINMHYMSGDNREMFETQLAARIDVTVVSKDSGLSIGDEIKLLNEGLKKKNYKLGDFIETINNVKVNPLIGSSRVDVYQLGSETLKLAGYEYWVAVLQTKSRYYLVRLITISRGENFRTWAQNTQTYKVLLGSLGPASKQSTD